ncbi:MAG: hypothetical protein ACEPO2_14665 [Pelagibaca sp.]
MQEKVIFRDRQEIQAKDLNNAQAFAADTIKAVVNDGLTDERRFTGFGVSSSSATDITVEAGRLYSEGQVYARKEATDFSLFTYLPVATKRVLALVVWGQTNEAAVEPRDFLIDLTTGATEPQAVAMEERQAVQINVVAGVESADPVAPAVPDNTVIVALIVLDTTGVSDIQFQFGNQLPNTKDNQRDISELQSWRSRIGPQIEAVQTNIAALEEKTDGKVDRVQFIEAVGDLARLREAVGLPDDYSLFGSDAFFDDAETDAAAAGYDARVEQGALFPFAASTQAPLALFNPVDDRIVRSATDWVLPKYSEEAKITVTGFSGDLSVSQFLVGSHPYLWYGWNRWHWYYGWYWGRSRSWWRLHGWRYFRQYSVSSWRRWAWRYHVPYPYNPAAGVTGTFNGTIVGQTFLTPSAFWLTSIDLFLTQVGPSGDVQVLICETEYGKPVLEKTLARVTVNQSDLVRYPNATRARVPAIWLDAGKRYAVMIVTEGAHRVAMASGNAYTQGTFFYGNDGDFFTGDMTRNLMFSANGAVFEQPRTEIVLGNVSLAGGITDIAIETEAVVPDGCSLSYEAQVAGRWYPFETANLLATQPDILPLRAIVLGTRDAAPGFQLGAGRLLASRPKSTVQHVSTLRSLPGGATTSSVTVTFFVAGYDDAAHTFAARLLNADDTELALPSAIVAEVDVPEGTGDDEGTGITRIRATFALGSAVSEYKIEYSGTRSTDAEPFRVIERTDVAV